MPDVMVDDALVDGIVTHPDLALHHKALHRVSFVLWALDLVGVPTVAIIGLNLFVGLKKMAKKLVEYLDVVCPGPAWGISS